MSGFYFLNESIRDPSQGLKADTVQGFLPVKIKQETWEHLEDPRRIRKTFFFDDKGQQAFFVGELMQSLDIANHAIQILISSGSVTVETYTEMYEDVTELDLEIARISDRIFDDARFVVV